MSEFVVFKKHFYNFFLGTLLDSGFHIGRELQAALGWAAGLGWGWPGWGLEFGADWLKRVSFHPVCLNPGGGP